MRNRRSLLTVCLLALLLAGIASGSVFVIHTIRTYDGTCEKLAGFPGLLQGTGLLCTGNCGNAWHCNDGPCTVGGKPGHCQEQWEGHERHCVCVPTHISR